MRAATKINAKDVIRHGYLADIVLLTDGPSAIDNKK